MFIIGAINSF